jgi:hypothetical protein
VKGKEHVVGLRLKEVNEDNMESELGKVLNSATTNVGCLGIVEGRKTMGNVDDLEFGIDA